MDLIDKEDDVRILLGFADDVFEAGFEFSSEIGTRYDQGEVEREDALARERGWDAIGSDPSGELSDESGLADPRLSDEERVVLRAAGEYGQEPIDLIFPTDEAVRRSLSGIRGELIECRSPRLLFGRRSPERSFRSFEKIRQLGETVEMEVILDGRGGFDGIDAERSGDEPDIIDIGREQSGDEMLGADVREGAGAGQMESISQDIGNRRRESWYEIIRELLGFLALQAELAELFLLEPHVFEEEAAETAVFEENRQKKVSGLYGVVFGIAGDIPRFLEAMPRVEGEFFEKRGVWHNGEEECFRVGVFYFFAAALSILEPEVSGCPDRYCIL